MCSSGRLKVIKEMNATILASAEKATNPPVCIDGKYLVDPGAAIPITWPYTLHDTDESPFNLNHGYMWGRFAGMSDWGKTG